MGAFPAGAAPDLCPLRARLWFHKSRRATLLSSKTASKRRPGQGPLLSYKSHRGTLISSANASNAHRSSAHSNFIKSRRATLLSSKTASKRRPCQGPHVSSKSPNYSDWLNKCVKRAPVQRSLKFP